MSIFPRSDLFLLGCFWLQFLYLDGRTRIFLCSFFIWMSTFKIGVCDIPTILDKPCNSAYLNYYLIKNIVFFVSTHKISWCTAVAVVAPAPRTLWAHAHQLTVYNMILYILTIITYKTGICFFNQGCVYNCSFHVYQILVKKKLFVSRCFLPPQKIR